MFRRTTALTGLFLMVIAVYSANEASGEGQKGVYFRTNYGYYRPMIADIRRTHNHMRLYRSDPVKFTNPTPEKNSHTFWDVGFGETFPIVGWNFTDLTQQNSMNRGHAKGAVFFLEGSAHMLLDFGAKSNAIINTDFRIGGGVMGRFTSHFSFRARAFHESSHLGDEFVIDAMQRKNSNFQRYNVGYNASELYLAFDDHREPLGVEVEYRLYAGGRILYKGDEEKSNISIKRFFSEKISSYEAYIDYDPDGNPLNKSLFAGNKEFQWGFEGLFPFPYAEKKIWGFELPSNSVFAADFYRRDKYSTSEATKAWSQNLVFGVVWGDYFKHNFLLKGEELSEEAIDSIKNTIALLVNYYNGPNPHGQFRQEDLEYWGIGLSITF